MDPIPGPQIVDQTRSPDLFTQLVHPTCGALKTRSCSGLDLWIVHAWEVFDSWIVPVWNLKNEELFRI